MSNVCVVVLFAPDLSHSLLYCSTAVSLPTLSLFLTLYHSTVPAVLLQLWSQDGQIQHTIECGGEIGSVLVVGEFVFCGFKVQSEGTDYGMLKAWNLGDGGEFVMQVRVFWFESGVTRHVETSCVFACTVLQWCMCALFRKVF